ncbi:MAG TPA: DUF1501 domain-containing protein [Gemmataceae bacterium]|jgi:uncharacterized protein (DUF1501 family)|nr:DUF1501 domain-containing protein [Gemmataceae bacterium]
MLTRRSFLKSSSLLALAPTVPVFITRTANAAGTEKDSNVLVVVQLDGGNDALNTLIPLKNETYANLRPRLKIADKDAIKLNDEFGLHPSFRQAETLIKAGHLLAIPGVGYPNPSRSHFDSMAIWQTARTDPEEFKGYGWLGRTLDTIGGDSYTISNDVPRTLRGRRSAAIAMTRLEDLTLADSGTVKNAAGPEAQQDLLAFVRRHAVDGSAAADKMAAMAKATDGGNYPGNALGERLKLIARLMKADLGTRVFYTTQSGYDTHATQQFTHSNLLAEFAGAVNAFFDDLKSAKLAERVTLLAFSEFGRTIKENGSLGTDHGTAGVTFLCGPKVKAGVAGTLPSLTDLEKGEPKMTTDFRRIYATILHDWLGVTADVLAGSYERLKLFA